MKQLVFIHGGETFADYEAYIEALRTDLTYDPEKDKQRLKRWRYSLAQDLGDEWQVLSPEMPSKYNAKYLEWSIWFEKVIPYLKDDAVLVGHSLGGIFLAKYLSEHILPISVRATLLIAAPFDTRDADFSLADFTLGSLEAFSAQAGKIFLYQSTDDTVVPFSALEAYRERLPDATARIFSDRGHFLQEEFPELIEEISSLF
jgi:uncharacterized protein